MCAVKQYRGRIGLSLNKFDNISVLIAQRLLFRRLLALAIDLTSSKRTLKEFSISANQMLSDALIQTLTCEKKFELNCNYEP